MEVRDPPDPLGARSQERGPEMQCSRSLAEPRARNDANPGRVQEAETVELVGLTAFGFCLLTCFFRDGHGGEEIHGALGVRFISFVKLKGHGSIKHDGHGGRLHT